AAIWPAA
ncbi:hypothetical protein D043_0297B, partial [Vibrio parahaemolyticus EKP-021]